MGIATVYLSGIASASVRVEIEDGLEPHAARLAALDAGLDQGVPGLCHHCAGYAQRWSREDPGEWGFRFVRGGALGGSRGPERVHLGVSMAPGGDTGPRVHCGGSAVRKEAAMGRHSASVPAWMSEPIVGEDLVESLPPIVPATPADTGCWLDGTYGWHNTYRIIDTATGRGMPLSAEDEAALDLYRAGEGDEISLTVGEIAEEALTWLNDHVAPEGYVFEWYEGDLMLWSAADSCRASGDRCFCVEPHN